MKKLFLLLMLTVGSFTAFATETPAEAYLVNDQQVEQLFTQSTDVSLAAIDGSMALGQQTTSGLSDAKKVQAKEFAPALLLNLFVGYLGIHRLYLGTQTLTWVGYILTCGGIFGIVPLVDLIVLIINNDNLAPYIDNPKFFMWAN
ncbi:TM2 domain-containing protein [Tellurirhabdus bombi]|uniref:TM2 domain-containing protein n=1 Tax=Tellurirhabdus bombi TaxID=2907205 RepID=UPI001F1B73B2|nr:TM2 domain-containing protein [Tellurirhabdus bombi]